jgi:D-lyxose ketol-isomerase
MLHRRQVEEARRRVVSSLEAAGVALSPAERDAVEVEDFGFSRLEEIGLQSVVYVSTERVCAKELVLFPGQTCPEHRHPPFGSNPGKEETFRCRAGLLYLYVPGEPTRRPAARPPADRRAFFTVRREVVLRPGEQFTVHPGERHWFQAGPEGAIVSEFASGCPGGVDEFTDPAVEPDTSVVTAS